MVVQVQAPGNVCVDRCVLAPAGLERHPPGRFDGPVRESLGARSVANDANGIVVARATPVEPPRHQSVEPPAVQEDGDRRGAVGGYGRIQVCDIGLVVPLEAVPDVVFSVPLLVQPHPDRVLEGPDVRATEPGAPPPPPGGPNGLPPDGTPITKNGAVRRADLDVRDPS